MAKLTIKHEADVEETADYPGVATAEGLHWCKQMSPDDYSLRLVSGALEAGGRLTWGGAHADEAVYVLDGELDADGHVCPTGGAVVVEAGVPMSVVARQATRFVHLSRTSTDPLTPGVYGSPDPAGHVCHVLGPSGWFTSGAREGVLATWFADSTCPTCRIALFKVEHRHGFAGDLHSHTQDEIIYVLDGSVQLGKTEHFAGTAFSIAADTRYKVGYPHGGTFLNYRADVSEASGADYGPLGQSALARGGVEVDDFR